MKLEIAEDSTGEKARRNAMGRVGPLHRTLRGALLALLLAAPQAHAAPLPPAARGEIEGLLSRLAASGCQFRRNGSWHTAAEAQAHLRRKLDYLVDKGAVASAEQFIERAAIRSSVSGRAYQVKCGSDAPVASSAWLRAELAAMRGGSGHQGPARRSPENPPGERPDASF
jgi:chemotaxis regulatin CheY-phosphate phosphatase CheZ